MAISKTHAHNPPNHSKKEPIVMQSSLEKDIIQKIEGGANLPAKQSTENCHRKAPQPPLLSVSSSLSGISLYGSVYPNLLSVNI